ncbi:MAG: serine hydrolase domain-containing protein [Dehalococcoidia bacterium]
MVTAEPTLSAEELGLDPTRLGYLDSHLRSYVDEGKLAGTLMLVARHGEIGHFQANGLADRERNVPMKQDTIFRIYSMSKPITAVALMQLFERGLVQIDDPVEKYIPEWAGLQVYSSGTYPNFQTKRTDRPMTVRDLLSHQSGLTYGFLSRTNVDAAYRELKIDEGGKDRSLKCMVSELAQLPLEFSPGSAWNYSVGIDICGYLVEVISGQRFDDYLRTNIFEPLGMEDTAFHVPAAKQSRFAANYSVNPGGTLSLTTVDASKGFQLADDPATSTYLQPPTYLSGGGGLVSAAMDYFKFAQMLCNDGELLGERIIGRKTLELMVSNHLPGGTDLMHHARGQWAETTFSGIGFGLGVSVTLDPSMAQLPGTPGEFAWGGAASTAFWVDPIEELVVVFMTQLMPSSFYNIRRELRTLIYGALTD